MLVLRLAWRSFVRNRRRSLITVAAVSLSLAMIIVFVGVDNDVHEQMASLGIRLGEGCIMVQDRGYQENQTLDYLVADPSGIMTAVKSIPGVTQAVPRVRANGLLIAGESSAPVMVSGVVPPLEPLVSVIPSPDNRVAGAYLRSRNELKFKNEPADIYIGEELAKILKLSVGDRTVLTVFPPGASGPAQAAYTVRGIFRTGIRELDQSYVEVPLYAIQSQLGISPKVTQVALFVKNIDDTERITAEVRDKLPPGLEVLSWKQALKELYDTIKLDGAGMYLMLGVILIIVAIGIFNTVLMSVVERTREFGVMMAIGTSPARVFMIVVTEAAIMAVIAGAIGLGIGLGLHLWIRHTGIDIGSSWISYQVAGVFLQGRIYSLITGSEVLKWALVVVGMTVASALYPAYRATRLRPVEAIHHV